MGVGCWAVIGAPQLYGEAPVDGAAVHLGDAYETDTVRASVAFKSKIENTHLQKKQLFRMHDS